MANSLIWLVLLGGAARASDARIISRHRTHEAARLAKIDASARLLRAVGVPHNGIGLPHVYVSHVDDHAAALRGTEAVQALCGTPRREVV